MINEDDDIAELLYIFYEVNNRLDDEGTFPTAALHEQISGICGDTEKRECFISGFQTGNFENIRELLLDGVNVYNESEETYLKPKIGLFTFNGDMIKANPVEIEDGMLLGKTIVPQVNLHGKNKGIVSYNSDNKFFYITSNSVVPEELHQEIIDAFNLGSHMVVFVTNREY